MNTLGNPQAYYNGFISASRNVFLTSSVGMAMHGYANSFNHATSSLIVMICAKIIFIFSFLYGLNSVLGMNKYLNILENNNNQQFTENIQIGIWRRNMYLVCLYLLIILILFTLKLRRFFTFNIL
jgi:ABC-type transport system involved in cytochrome bd biosynthesis fused ATPase/permease subunit